MKKQYSFGNMIYICILGILIGFLVCLMWTKIVRAEDRKDRGTAQIEDFPVWIQEAFRAEKQETYEGMIFPPIPDRYNITIIDRRIKALEERVKKLEENQIEWKSGPWTDGKFHIDSVPK